MSSDDDNNVVPFIRSRKANDGYGGGHIRNPETDGRIKPTSTHIVSNDYDGDGGPDNELFDWLRDHPEFIDRPATIEQFLGPHYLNIEKRVRPGVRAALIKVFGKGIEPERISEMRRAMVTGGIGCGKTTFASVAIPYIVHWVLCLYDPQDYFGFMEGTRIHVMLMSTTDSQAKKVLFGDVKARLAASPWFRANAVYDKNFTNELRFPKGIWVLPGNSQETTFEGFNLIAGVIDEGDSHKIVKDKDYAQAGWDTIHSRISSRFDDPETGSHRGLLIAIGQMKTSTGFMARKKKELENDPEGVAITMTLWESYGWSRYKKKGKYDVFWYDIARKEIVSAEYARDVGARGIIPIPSAFLRNFLDNPVKALRDLAGIPPDASDPFIVLPDRIDLAMERWHLRYPDIPTPVSDSCINPLFADNLCPGNTLRRVLHVDIAYSDAVTADSLGMAMAHVPFLVEMDGELKPYIVFDFLLRIKAVPGKPIMLADMRSRIYQLKFDRQYRVDLATFDGMQSVDTMQTLRRKRINADYLSPDRSKGPYEDLRDALYERRVEFPKYVTFIRPGSTERVIIAKQELTQLNDEGKKVNHPPGGSKDVTDCMACVTHVLMGSPQFRRGLQQRGIDDLRNAALDDYGTGIDLDEAVTLDAKDFEVTIEDDLMELLGGNQRPKFPRTPEGMPALERNPGETLRLL